MRLKTDEIKRTVLIIKKALNKYPIQLLRSNIDNVYIVKSLYFSGIIAAGTNSKRNLYISNDGETQGYTNEFIESSFH